MEVDTSYTHAPVLIHREAPAYPENLRLSHVQGPVVLRVLVGKDGRVRDLHVLEGTSELRGLAVDAVKKWIFEPYYSDGRKPEPVWIRITVTFPP
jgi:TonB family protein